jgi:RsiW-degrading membrane proteinase PrsW (M82 family)
MIRNLLFSAKLLPDCPGDVCGWCELIQLGQNIIDFMIEISLVLAIAFIVYGGIMIMVNSYKPEKLQESRSIIWSALIGLVIVLASWVILNTFFHLLTGNLNWPWNQISC